MSSFSPGQQAVKPAVHSDGGVVAAQHVGAARVGAAVLAAGGNALDAAIATSFAIGVLEPWMSGIGGGGLMVLRHADGRVETLDAGMRAPAGLDPAAYRLAEGEAEGLFTWPAVEGDVNMSGPLAIAVPGLVDGLGVAHAAWGSHPWADLVAPAIDLARRGLSVDWYASLIIGQAAVGLARFEASRARFLPGGHPPPIGLVPGRNTRLPAPALAETLEVIARDGPRALHEGPLAEAVARDAAAVGSPLSAADLAQTRARLRPPLAIGYRDAQIWATPELSAGPTLAHSLRLLSGFAPGATPDPGFYTAMAQALAGAYALRLTEMGDVDGGRDTGRDAGCTTHISVADRHGMTVSLTQTLLSVFGSMVTLPETGILMNNGIFWFDPRPGGPNALAPGKRCLANMCPVVMEAGGRVTAIGASGGRRIMPAVAQIAAFLGDFGMDLETALHMPRLDMSGGAAVTADDTLPAPVIAALRAAFPVAVEKRSVFPNWFANISAAQSSAEAQSNAEAQSAAGGQIGATEPWLPWADASAAPSH
ncbi:MAG: gamma-glutamyltransferase [Pseudomonadota bacterium]